VNVIKLGMLSASVLPMLCCLLDKALDSVVYLSIGHVVFEGQADSSTIASGTRKRDSRYGTKSMWDCPSIIRSASL
jgi:hypothetical protein